jgi:hypothetical protein
MVSTSTDGDRAPKGVPASSGGNEVWRSGWADARAEVIEIAEALRRFRAGAAAPSEVRFLFADIVLMPGSCECEYGGECADGEAIGLDVQLQAKFGGGKLGGAIEWLELQVAAC